jgi:predicted Zn-dependent protease
MTTLAFPQDLEDFDPLVALDTIAKTADWVGLRYVTEGHQYRKARNGCFETNRLTETRGVMIESRIEGQIAYAATSDLSTNGLRKAAEKASAMARSTAHLGVATLGPEVRPASFIRHEGAQRIRIDRETLSAFTEKLITATQHLKVSDAIVTAVAEATLIDSMTHYVSTSGADLRQHHHLTYQNFSVIASNGQDFQQRSLNGPTARCFQSGLESFDWETLFEGCETTGREALALLDAEDCPQDCRDLILAPDQMLLQIHESIGHPLELDRILGDERNFAGWSFVKPADFGHLQYGSPLMNVTFDPTYSGEFASYAFDDGGAPAQREYLIREGRLLRGLGGLESQLRSGLPGVANFRSSGWNRAPIDRMANLNLEPGCTSLDQLIASVDRGIYMQSNRSWSIDDYRNKFQFGCEYAQLIEEGRLTRVVKNPNYRGLTLPFWHSLAAVGDAETFGLFGTPYCGKGEPNQMIRVGHASPACLFRNIEVFGGAA